MSIKCHNLYSFKEGVIHLCQSIPESRQISHLLSSALFAIPVTKATKRLLEVAILHRKRDVFQKS